MKAFIFDTETTGLVENRSMNPKKLPEIIEFYGCVYDWGTSVVEEEVDSLCKPQLAPISAEITKITRIDNHDVENAPAFREIVPAIESSMAKCQAVIAHNLSFDKDMLEIEFERLGLTVKWPALNICTVEQTIHYKGYRLSLTDLHELLFQRPFPEAHRAKHDTQALINITTELIKRGDI